MNMHRLAVWIAFLSLVGGMTTTAIGDEPNIEGEFHRKAVLLATTNAPTEAGGAAKLKAHVTNGVLQAELKVKTKGLRPGTYAVSVADMTGGKSVELGSFDVPDSSDGDGKFALPATLHPASVGSVSIADSNKVVDLIGLFPGLNYDIKIKTVLAATTNAPAGASGRADLDADNKYGEVDGKLKVETRGLLAGKYSVNLTDSTGKKTYAVGTLDAPGWKTPKGHAAGSQHDDKHKGLAKGKFDLPENLDPLDVAGISINNSNSLPVLAGDFTNATHMSKGHFKITTTVIPGPSYSNVVGQATLDLKSYKGKAHNHLRLVVEGLPSEAEMTLLVNGVVTQTVRSNAGGRLVITRLKKVDLAKLDSLVAQDKSGATVFSVSF
jgi:hypothetical protein